MPPAPQTRLPAELARTMAGGFLMGLANLVPGISGGTMLLAAGVYPQCIEALARWSKLRPNRDAVVTLAAVGASAGLTVLLLAGAVKGLVVDHRWAMYSLFLGSTLGGVPVLWKLLGQLDARSVSGALAGLAAMAAITWFPAAPATAAGGSAPALFLAGLGAVAAMLLPGLSGGYLLVLSGQYVAILGAVDGIKAGLVHEAGPQWPDLVAAGKVLAPVAAGGLLALAVVSTVLQVLLRQQRALVLGLLLGLLLGAVLGLWPFRTDAQPPALTLPGAAQAAGSLALALGGYVLTWAIARLGDGRDGA